MTNHSILYTKAMALNEHSVVQGWSNIFLKSNKNRLNRELRNTVEPPRSGFLRSGHLPRPRPDMIIYEILQILLILVLVKIFSTIKNKRN